MKKCFDEEYSAHAAFVKKSMVILEAVSQGWTVSSVLIGEKDRSESDRSKYSWKKNVIHRHYMRRSFEQYFMDLVIVSAFTQLNIPGTIFLHLPSSLHWFITVDMHGSCLDSIINAKVAQVSGVKWRETCLPLTLSRALNIPLSLNSTL